MRIGVLTSGGDCPGLNAVIRAVVLKGVRNYGDEFVGFLDGWRGPLEGDYISLDTVKVRGLSKEGGTILGTSRTNAFSGVNGPDRIKHTMAELGVEALVAIGGEGTLAGAGRLFHEGIPIVGVPKTIDNDLGSTDRTFGFDTAVAIATEGIDRLRTTGNSHHRIMVLEVMGRHAGWIALQSGMAGGAHAILIPEVPVSLDELVGWVESVRGRNRSPMIVVSEGFKFAGTTEEQTLGSLDAAGRPRLGGIGQVVAQEVEKATGVETRATVLGHLQRGGSPTAFDRVLATRLGLGAIDAVNDRDFGQMVALRGTDIVRVSLDDAVKELKTVPKADYEEARVLFG